VTQLPPSCLRLHLLHGLHVVTPQPTQPTQHIQLTRIGSMIEQRSTRESGGRSPVRERRSPHRALSARAPQDRVDRLACGVYV
jgi:hypothetical protein